MSVDGGPAGLHSEIRAFSVGFGQPELPGWRLADRVDDERSAVAGAR